MNERVRVYFNLHKKKLSVQRKVDGRWLVWQHMDVLTLTNVKFIVSEAGRQRVLRQCRKNVHAFVEGEPLHFHHGVEPIVGRVIRYNPFYNDKFFFMDTKENVEAVDYLCIKGRLLITKKK